MSESWPVGLVRERDEARTEVERLQAELRRLQNLDQYGPNLAKDWEGEARRLQRTNSRLRKAVTWLMGALHDESIEPSHGSGLPEVCEAWECMRARAVLDETKEVAND